MWFKKKNLKWWQKKKFVIPLSIFVFLVVARIVLEPVLHYQANKYLATFSPKMSAHIGDLDLSIYRGAYTFEQVTAKLKADDKRFLKVGEIDVSIAWRELFKGRILSDIRINDMTLNYTAGLPDAFVTAAKKDEPKDVKETLFPVQVERLDLESSTLVLEDYRDVGAGKPLTISQIDGFITNLTPKKNHPTSFFNLSGSIMESSVMKTAGTLNMVKKPMEWNVDSELQKFDLTSVNQFMRRKIPVTFTQGKLDLYAEAKSQNGKIKGYVKPILQNLDVMKPNEEFDGAKHWLVEVATALGNLILRASDPKTVATRIPFTYDGTFKVDTGESISKAIEHGFSQQLSPGIENTINLNE